jgi:hypothetical protein
VTMTAIAGVQMLGLPKLRFVMHKVALACALVRNNR